MSESRQNKDFPRKRALNSSKIGGFIAESDSVVARLSSAIQQNQIPNIESEITGSGNVPLYARVYKQAREALLSGVLAPGDLLNIRPVAAALGTSTMPVRDALARLVADGALESLANRAFRVPLIDEAGFKEILLMRLRLESLACEHAAVKATREQVSEIGKACSRMIEASGESVASYLFAHRRFHFSVYDSARLPLLMQAIEALWLRIGPLLYACVEEADLSAENIHHLEILHGIERADALIASRAVHNDLLDASTHVLTYLEKRKARDSASE